MEMINCCFCGKEIEMKQSHDPRPIVSNNGDRCCEHCNANIVVPTRIQIWKSDNSLKIEELTAIDKLRQANYERMQKYFIQYNVVDLVDNIQQLLKDKVDKDTIQEIEKIKEGVLNGVENTTIC